MCAKNVGEWCGKSGKDTAPIKVYTPCFTTVNFGKGWQLEHTSCDKSYLHIYISAFALLPLCKCSDEFNERCPTSLGQVSLI